MVIVRHQPLGHQPSAISLRPSAIDLEHHGYRFSYGATGPSLTTATQISFFLPILSRYTGNPRYSPTGSKRSGENEVAGPALYQRAPANSSPMPLGAAGRGIDSISVRAVRPRS